MAPMRCELFQSVFLIFENSQSRPQARNLQSIRTPVVWRRDVDLFCTA